VPAMPLDYVDFAHHYEGSPLSDEQRRENFDVFANLMECIARALWRDDASAKALGISLDGISLEPSELVESEGALTNMFNEAADAHAAGKKDS